MSVCEMTRFRLSCWYSCRKQNDARTVTVAHHAHYGFKCFNSLNTVKRNNEAHGQERTTIHFLPCSSHLAGFCGAGALAVAPAAGDLKGVGAECVLALNGCGPERSCGFLCVFMSSVTFFKPTRQGHTWVTNVTHGSCFTIDVFRRTTYWQPGNRTGSTYY